MYTPLSTILSVALSACALVQSAAAAEESAPLNRRQNINAQSVSTADFKSRFEQSGIVPEVIAALDPAVSFYASYKTANGQDALLAPGSSLTVAEAQLPFEFMVENLANATGITVNTRYLIYLLDADAPSRDDPTARNLRHYLAGNYSLSSTMSGVLPTAQRLFLPSQNAFPFTPFTAPAPAANTGVHRFIYALYAQPDRFNTANFDSVGMPTETSNWDLPSWRMQLTLGPAIGATFFSIDTNANGGQGTSASGSINVQAPGANGTNGSAGLSARSYLAAVIALALGVAMF